MPNVVRIASACIVDPHLTRDRAMVLSSQPNLLVLNRYASLATTNVKAMATMAMVTTKS